MKCLWHGLSQGSNSLVSVSVCCWVTCASVVCISTAWWWWWWWPEGAYGVHGAPPLCLIDQECWCFDCQAKNDRLRVEMPTFYRCGIDEPLCEGLEDRSFTCLNKTQLIHNSQSVFGPVLPLPVKVTWLDLQSLSRPQEEISNHTVSPAVRRDCLFPRKHGDMLRVVGRERARSRWDLRDRSLLGLLECSCSPRIPGIVGERIMDKACILEMI